MSITTNNFKQTTMQISKKLITELCKTCTFDQLMVKLNDEYNTTLPKSTIKKLLKDNGLKTTNSKTSIVLIDDTAEEVVTETVTEDTTSTNNY